MILVERLSQVTNSSVFDDFVKIRKYLRGRGGEGIQRKEKPSESTWSLFIYI